MKIFNVHLEVSLVEIGEDLDSITPATNEPITDTLKAAGVAHDSPFTEMAKSFDVMQKRGILPGPPAMTAIAFPSSGGESLNMHHNFKMVGDFQDQQELLAKFRKLAESFTMPKV